jgi:hypothetical protein
MQHPHTTEEQDQDIVAIWLRRDPTRWIAGVIAGLFSGVMTLVFAMILSKIGGAEIWLPAKVMALPFLGNTATAYGFNIGPIVLGFVFIEALCAILGLAYAHFTGAGSSVQSLLGMGLTWGAFGWVFIMNLFLQSFRDVQYMEISPGVTFPIMMVFGLALASVSFFDRMLRGAKTH